MNQDAFDPEYLADVSGALAEVLGEAKALVDARHIGTELDAAMAHARDLHVILLEQAAVADQGTRDEVRGFCNALTMALARLTEIMDRDISRLREG